MSLFSISMVSATENVTDNVICDTDDNPISVDDNQVIIEDSSIDDSSNNDEVLSSIDDEDIICLENDNNNVLGASPPYNAYSLSVNNHIIRSGAGGSISISVTSATGYSYAYDFYLKIYDSSNSLKINKRYYSSYSTSTISHSISSNELPVGTYTMKLYNCVDNKLMDSAKLTIAQSDSASSALTYDQYSIRVSSTTINYGSSGTITMSITPSSSRYKYDFYLKVYDSSNNEKISQRYSSTASDTSKTYTVSANQLNVGTYTIKIINTYDSKVMSTATLTVKSGSSSTTTYPSYSAYSVSVSSSSMTYGSGGSISMSISPASSSTYKYYYTLKVYDSNNNVKISQVYSGTSAAYSKTYSVGSTELSAGTYTVKIVNYADSILMDAATLTIQSDSMYKKNVVFNAPSTIHTSYSCWDTYGPKELVIKSPEDMEYDLKGIPITIKVNGKTFTKKIDYYNSGSSGWINGVVFKLSDFGLKPGTYDVAINFAGDDYYQSSSWVTKLIVEKDSVDAFVSTKKVSYGGDFNFVIINGNSMDELSGLKVSVNIKGISKTFTTDKDGYVYFSTNGLTPKTYTATISFGGNGLYKKSTVKLQVIVKKGTPKVIAKAKSFKKSVKTKKYTITLKNDMNNKAINKVKVTLKVNGKTYKAITNSKGKATFKITKLTKKGKHTATIKYAGNKYYNTKSVKAKITVK